MKKIIILSNSNSGLISFRQELIEQLIKDKYKVYISVPDEEGIDFFEKMGCIVIKTRLNRRGTNPIKDFNLLRFYIKIIKNIKPDVILTYTIKPNIYGGLACKIKKIPYIVNITGLGTAIEKNNLLSKILIQMYRIALKNAKCVFCQNLENMEFLKKNKIAVDELKLIPGSGVNLSKFEQKKYPQNDKTEFIFIGRIMKEKGIEQYLEIAKYITSKYDNIIFNIVGRCEEDYKNILSSLQEENIINYYGEQMDVRPFIEKSHCTIHPSYYPEGMSNVLLESAATGRPVITTDRPGCREIVENGKTGFIVKPKDIESLKEAVEKFINLSYNEKVQMGVEGRKKVEKEFDRNIVIDAYLKKIKNI